MSYTNIGSGSNRLVDRKSVLELDNILVWEVTSSTSRNYLISLQGYSESKCSERVMVSDGRREASVIKGYQNNGFFVSCCSVACRMTVKEQNCYNEALYNGEFDTCIGNLYSLEIYLNRVYGYHSTGKKYQKNKH